jgi:hypothetical protein
MNRSKVISTSVSTLESMLKYLPPGTLLKETVNGILFYKLLIYILYLLTKYVCVCVFYRCAAHP